MRVLYAFIGSHPDYNGISSGNVMGGGSFAGVKGEIHNYSRYDDGYYGYVEPSAHGTITVNANFPETYSEKYGYADDVLVVWLAARVQGDRETAGQYVIAGWYKHARVYRCKQDIPENVRALRPAEGISDPVFYKYNVRAEEAVLIPESERTFIVTYKEHQRYVIAKGKLPDDEILRYVEEYDTTVNERISRIEQPELTGEEIEVLAKARINQDKFRTLLLNKYKCTCAVKPCGITFDKMLIASHIIPWSECGGAQRLTESNGLLLCANHDKLFDQGFITFDNDGKMLISDVIPPESQIMMNISGRSHIDMTDGMRPYMKYHRENKFKG